MIKKNTIKVVTSFSGIGSPEKALENYKLDIEESDAREKISTLKNAMKPLANVNLGAVE